MQRVTKYKSHAPKYSLSHHFWLPSHVFRLCRQHTLTVEMSSTSNNEVVQVIEVVTVVGLRMIISAPAGSPTEHLKLTNNIF
jgi:hypothetical protein